MYVCMYVCMYVKCSPFLLAGAAAVYVVGAGVGGEDGGRGSLDWSGAEMMKPYGGTLESASSSS